MPLKRRDAQHDGRSATPDPPRASKWPLLAILPYSWARYGHALRPWSFTASYFPMLLTALSIVTVPGPSEALWVGQEPQFLAKFLVVLVAGISVHAGANLTNTYFDYVGRVDDDNYADDRTILDGRLSADTVLAMSCVCYAVSAASWALLVKQAGASLLYVAVTGGFLGWAYTAKPFGLKYRACGEIIVFFCFGPLLALATALALGAPLGSQAVFVPVAVSLAPATLTVGILHANNARDITSDRAAGTDTLAQWLGPSGCCALYTVLLRLPYVLAAAPTLGITGVHDAWGWRPPLYALFTVPLSTDLYRAYQRGCLAELPQQTAQFHALFSACLALSMLQTATLARVMLGLLFVMGGGNNFYTWGYTVPLVRDRLALALPCALPEAVAPILLAAASTWQIIGSIVFISGYGGPDVTRLAAQSLILFLTPITFIVHDFWATPKYTASPRPRKNQWEAAGCAQGGIAASAPIATFATPQGTAAQDSEFVHFWKNICILGGLLCCCQCQCH